MKNIIEEFKSILNHYDRYASVAIKMKTPNPEDDEFIRAAIVGFSQHAPTEEWTHSHYEYILNYRQGDFSDKSFEFLYGEKALKVALFACLCLGALLGMYQIAEISEDEYKIAEGQLPGFMLLHADIF